MIEEKEEPEFKFIHRAEEHPKGWGRELWIHNDEDYCGKILEIKKGKTLSYHYHNEKKESFYLISGEVKVVYSTNEDEFFRVPTQILTLIPGDILEVPPKTPHCVIALEDSSIYEVSTHHKNEDSIRIVKGD